MVGLIYSLCALTALVCAVLLLRAYLRSRYSLLFWGGLCFIGLTLNNFLVIVDRFVLPFVDLSIWRLVLALAALLVFLYGLIWDSE
jgi:hydrogenase/urease accessory protein HupE